MVISLPKIPYTHRMYMVLANPIHYRTCDKAATLIPPVRMVQFVSDVMKPLNIDPLMDQEVQNLSGGDISCAPQFPTSILLFLCGHGSQKERQACYSL
jgi:hypothetical protein